MFDEKLLNQPDLLKNHKLFDGVQYIYRFSESKGASVVRHYGSYGSKKGLYELVAIMIDGNDFHINEEPTGWLTVDEVIEMLEGLKNERLPTPTHY
ncbi:hypothetical protein BU065_01180 [Staphylococcus succinus]|uniref:hypothetical protein n=1 Tax=Staphylococcus succinus TaxID=61015 RepID=UPI000E679D29|nr:hypothetical protein [Staphylococcus succinus]RIN37018.1 hypothetical protein BU065_01180 [Staphylococcus succinus]